MFALIQSFLHIDVTLIQWAHAYGSYIYVILFLIIFCETGLVVTPFLPGDSLLFAVGALASTGQFLDLKMIIPLLMLAATLGDSLNFFIGKKWGRKLFEKENVLLKRKYLTATEDFFARKGKWAVSLARFFPITRTIAPFFAGLSGMLYKRFITLSVIGTIVWVNLFAISGYYFGQIEMVQKNFTLLVMGIIVFSLLPFIISALRAYLAKSRKAS
ncbi:MAG: VTT domain-containing protein [Bdellovibrio sp.]|nr:VTT domain-containing protein [Bdellovibrio sp.]